MKHVSIPMLGWKGQGRDRKGELWWKTSVLSWALRRKPLSVLVERGRGKFPTVWPKVILPIALFDTTSHFLSSPIFLAVCKLFPLGCSANSLN